MLFKTTNISKYLSLFIVSLFLSSCSVAYNSISLIKQDGDILSKAEKKANKKKFRENVVFIHVYGEIIPLKNVEYNDSTTYEKSLTGETTMVNYHYEQSYYTLRNHKRDRMNELEVAGPKCAYFKQTHIFADSIINNGDKVQIQESNIEKITMYYRARVLLFILIAVGIGGFLFFWFIIDFISSHLYFA